MYQSFLSERFKKALLLAMELHQTQRYRKDDDTPYESHLMGTASLVLKYGGTEDEAIAAMLHDAIEDQAEKRGNIWGMKRVIFSVFGKNVLEIVEGCTDRLIPVNNGASWREMKQEKLNFLATQSSPSIRLVSMADKIDNLEAMLEQIRLKGDDFWKNFLGGGDAKDRLWFFQGVVNALQQAESAIDSDTLDAAELRRYKYRRLMLDRLNRLVTEFEEAAAQQNPKQEPGRRRRGKPS